MSVTAGVMEKIAKQAFNVFMKIWEIRRKEKP